LQIDSVTLERIARERFGMIRDHEILYLFAQPRDTTRLPTDTTSAASR
jgi:cell division protein FtsB